jgi:hypothetical protein
LRSYQLVTTSPTRAHGRPARAAQPAHPLPHDHAAAVHLRTRAARGDHRPNQQTRGLPGFSAWLRFGHEAIERNDPAEQEKITKFNTLLVSCVIFHTSLDMTAVLRQLAKVGWRVAPAAVAALSPYIRERIKRFGEYATHGPIEPPAAFDPRLDLTTRHTGDEKAAASAIPSSL